MRKNMSIRVGDRIRYLVTDEDGEVVAESNGCVMVRFGESFEYHVEREKLALTAGQLSRTVIHRRF
jgi:hypothetical protein